MKRRRLGRTGLVVSEICLGTMTFGNQADERTSHAILDRAYEAGVDFLDIAEVYPVPPDSEYAGRSEEIVGTLDGRQAARRAVHRHQGRRPGRRLVPRPGARRQDRARPPSHRARRRGQPAAAAAPTTSTSTRRTGPTAACRSRRRSRRSTRLVEAGKVRYVGCSNETAYGLTKSLWASEPRGLARYETIQNNFSLLNRRFEDELAEVCRREQVSLLPYSPIAGGVLTGKYQDGARPAGARFTLYDEGNPRSQAMSRRFVNAQTLESTARFSADRQRGRHFRRDARRRRGR